MAVISRWPSVERLEFRQLFAGLIGDLVSEPQCGGEPRAAIESSSLAIPATPEQPCIAVIDEVIDDIAVSVAAQNLSGLRAAELRFDYASDEIEVDPRSLKLGEAWRGRASLVQKVDDQQGTLTVFIYAAQPLSAPEGELLEFEASALHGPGGSSFASLQLVKFELNEGELTSLPWMNVESSTETVLNDFSSVPVSPPTAAAPGIPLLKVPETRPEPLWAPSHSGQSSDEFQLPSLGTTERVESSSPRRLSWGAFPIETVTHWSRRTLDPRGERAEPAEPLKIWSWRAADLGVPWGVPQDRVGEVQGSSTAASKACSDPAGFDREAADEIGLSVEFGVN